MEDIVILGVDIHVLEVADIIEAAGGFKLLGLIGDKPDNPPAFEGIPILGGKDALLAYPHARRLPMHVWKDRDDRTNWVSLIAPTAFVSSRASIGAGCIVYPHCFIGAKARMEDGVFMLAGSIINHDCVLEEGVCVTSHVTLAGGVTVRKGAYLGQQCAIKQFLTIGEGAYIGMSAVVTRDVPAHTTVMGNPARPYVKKG